MYTAHVAVQLYLATEVSFCSGASLERLARYRAVCSRLAPPDYVRTVSAVREHCNGEDRLAVAVLRHKGAVVNDACFFGRSKSRYYVPPKPL